MVVGEVIYHLLFLIFELFSFFSLFSGFLSPLSFFRARRWQAAAFPSFSVSLCDKRLFTGAALCARSSRFRMPFPSQRRRKKKRLERVDVYYCIQRLRKISNDVFAMVIDLRVEKTLSRVFSFHGTGGAAFFVLINLVVVNADVAYAASPLWIATRHFISRFVPQVSHV